MRLELVRREVKGPLLAHNWVWNFLREAAREFDKGPNRPTVPYAVSVIRRRSKCPTHRKRRPEKVMRNEILEEQ